MVKNLGEEDRQKFDTELDSPLPEKRERQSPTPPATANVSEEAEAESFRAFFGAISAG